MAEGYANDATTTLSAGVDATTQTIPLANAGPPLPPTPFRARIDDEYVVVISGRLSTAGAGSVTVTRAAEGSTAAAHNSGVTFAHILTAAGLVQGMADQVAAIPASNTGAGAGQPALRSLGTGATQSAAGSRAVYRGQAWAPALNSLKAANMKPSEASSTAVASLVNGTTYYAKVMVPEAFTVAQVFFGVTTAMAGATYAHLGLFSGNGATQLVDVDLLVTGHLGSSGSKTVGVAAGGTGVTPGAAGALDLVLDQFVYVGLLVVGATTAPQLNRSGNLNAGFANIGLTATDGYWWGAATGQTTLGPTAVASMIANGFTHFFGLG